MKLTRTTFGKVNNIGDFSMRLTTLWSNGGEEDFSDQVLSAERMEGGFLNFHFQTPRYRDDPINPQFTLRMTDDELIGLVEKAQTLGFKLPNDGVQVNINVDGDMRVEPQLPDKAVTVTREQTNALSSILQAAAHEVEVNTGRWEYFGSPNGFAYQQLRALLLSMEQATTDE